MVKKKDTMILKKCLIDEIINGTITITIDSTGISVFTSVIENNNTFYLFYAEVDTKTFFLINPLNSEKSSQFQVNFYKKWSEYAKNKLNINFKWSIGYFKFNTKKKEMKETDIPILVSFQSLQKKIKQYSLDINFVGKLRMEALLKFNDSTKGNQKVNLAVKYTSLFF